MKLNFVLGVLYLAGLSVAVPRKSLQKRQTSSRCSCPSGSTITQTSLLTIIETGSAVVTQNGGTVTTFGSTATSAITITRTTTTTDEPVTTTQTIGQTTVTVVGLRTTVTSTNSFTSTITTCIPTQYKIRRQVTASSTTTAAPSTITTTTRYSGQSRPVTCVCKLVSALGSSTTSTSPACLCPPVQTTTVTVSSTSTSSTVLTVTSSESFTSTVAQTITTTQYQDIEETETPTLTITTTQRRVTQTSYSTSETITATYTPTRVSCLVPSQSCSNQGIRFAAYKNTNAAGADNTNKDSTYSSFDPTVFKNRPPFYQNTTTTLGGFIYKNAQPVYIHLYNSPQTYISDYLTINHVGYVFAPLTGTYTWSLSAADDIVMLWIGANAYSGYTRGNANIVRYYGEGASTYRVNFVKGQYYPFRIMFANGQEALAFQASLNAPGGQVMLNSNSKASPYLVQYSCDRVTAPPFPDFGSET